MLGADATERYHRETMKGYTRAEIDRILDKHRRRGTLGTDYEVEYAILELRRRDRLEAKGLPLGLWEGVE
jgi:hypothetical protein